MAWHDASPWRRKRNDASTPNRIAEIVRQCRAGDLSLDDAIVAAYSAGHDDGVTLERERIASAEKPTEEART